MAMVCFNINKWRASLVTPIESGCGTRFGMRLVTATDWIAKNLGCRGGAARLILTASRSLGPGISAGQADISSWAGYTGLLGVCAEGDAGGAAQGPPVFKYTGANWELAVQEASEGPLAYSLLSLCTLHADRLGAGAGSRSAARGAGVQVRVYRPNLHSGVGRLPVGVRAAGSRPSMVLGSHAHLANLGSGPGGERWPQVSGACRAAGVHWGRIAARGLVGGRTGTCSYLEICRNWQ